VFPDKSVSASFLIFDVWQTHVSPVRWANRYMYRDSIFTFALCSCTAFSQSTAGLSFVLSGLRSAVRAARGGRSGAFRQRSEYSTGCVCALQSCNTCHFLHGRMLFFTGAGAGCAMCPELPIRLSASGFTRIWRRDMFANYSHNIRKLYL